jgi:hypothetical protein
MKKPEGKRGNLKPSQSQSLVRKRLSLYRLGARSIKMAGRIFLWGSVVVTIVAGFFYFLPRITVEPSRTYDPSNPSPLTFTISNTNVVPLRDVQPCLGVHFLDFGDIPETTQHRNGPTSKMCFGPWFAKWLDVDEKYQIIIEDAIRIKDSPKQIQNADITIAVIYTPWFLPSWWRSTKEFRFITRQLSDGKIYWVPVPLNR